MPARSLYLNQLNRTEDLTQPNFTQPLALTRGREYLIAFLHQLVALLLLHFVSNMNISIHSIILGVNSHSAGVNALEVIELGTGNCT